MMPAMSRTEVFERERRRLFGLAYRMLGSAAQAEDVVQEAWLRFHDVGPDVRSPGAWLSTVVTRICLDELKSARAQREAYVGPWLPEPVRTDGDPVDSESISMAFLVLLESLTPAERASYLLHEVFDYSHAEIAEILGKEEVACRQLVHRARAHVLERRPRYAPTREQHERLLGGFLQAVSAGDLTALRALLAEDVVSYSDGGGRVAAARKPVHGADAVARLFIGLAKKGARAELAIEIADINGWPSIVLREEGRVTLVLTLETDGERIYAARWVVNPDKLVPLNGA
jgi:RNA polymerase sigma-70 factor (ECF subfamily)